MSLVLAFALTLLFIGSCIITDLHPEIAVKLFNGLFNMHKRPGKTDYSTIEQFNT